MNIESQYLSAVRDILNFGEPSDDRTGVGTLSMFGDINLRHDFRDGFPLLTTKKVFFRGIAEELFWFLSGSTDVKDLQAKGVTIWDEWATAEQCAKFNRPEGQLGPIYGHLWRNFGAISRQAFAPHKYCNDGVDQITWVINEIRKNPKSRRLIVSGWDPREQANVALPPCHTLFQFHVGRRGLSCKLYMRSADMFLGVPFNIASYALLTMLVARVTGLQPAYFYLTIGDAHVYKNHVTQVREQLSRRPRELPKLELINDRDSIFDFGYNDIRLLGYDPYPAIKAPVAV